SPAREKYAGNTVPAAGRVGWRRPGLLPGPPGSSAAAHADRRAGNTQQRTGEDRAARHRRRMVVSHCAPASLVDAAAGELADDGRVAVVEERRHADVHGGDARELGPLRWRVDMIDRLE